MPVRPPSHPRRPTNPRGRSFPAGPVIGVLVLALWIAVRLADPAPLAALRSLTFDTYQRLDPRAAEAPSVMIVDIDEKSLAAVGQWPWARTTMAELVDRIAAAGAVAIGFDVLFPEADRLSAPELARVFAPTHPGVAALFTGLPDGDALFAAALARAPTVLGLAGTIQRPSSQGVPRPVTPLAMLGGDPRPDLVSYPALLANLAGLDAAARGRGLVSVVPDRDGVIRRIPLLAAAGGELVPALALEVIRVATGGRTPVVKRDSAGVRSVVLAGVEIPTDRSGHLWLHFGPHDPRRFVSAGDVLSASRPVTTLAGKIVLVGTSAAGLFDLRTTPIERVMPGVEIHAQAIESILGGAVLTRPNFATGVEVVLAAVLGLAVMIGVPRIGAVGTLVLGGVIAAGLVLASWVLFAEFRVLLDPSFVALASGSLFLLLVFGKYLGEERQRTTIRDAFRQYLSADMVERLVREPDRLKLGGETREVTVMFTDFRGFTAVAERYKTNPEGLTRLMNALLSPLSLAIVERRGTIDKYMGDAIMAFWNAPLDDADHPANACLAALDVVRKLDALNAELRVEGTEIGIGPEPLEIGIGIATGINVVGNMGSDIRFDYTVLGDSVNVASRLQGLSRVKGARILVAAPTVEACTGLAFLEVDRVVLKGRREPETVYALVGGPGVRDTPAFAALEAGWAAARASARGGDADGARRHLDALPVGDVPEARALVAAFAAELDAAGRRSD